MKSRSPLLVLLLTALSFAFKDSDLDGVEDSKDRCPGTPILVLVDRYGCPIERPKGRFYLRLGASFVSSGDERRASAITSVAYYYNRFYISATTRYYFYSRLYDSGMGDTTLYGSYRIPLKNLYVIPGLRVRLPTGERPFSDGDVHLTPSAIFDLLFDSFNLFLYAGYTFRSLRRNTYALSVGGGYDITRKTYVSLSYDTAESVTGGGNLNYITLFLLRDITRSLYTTLSYSYGLNRRSVDHSLTVRLGVRF
ncbi:MAG: hypothetical protein Q9N26_07455 [Aquificota bacterium]|nr:hypothetical protein [Aquificota bacterium]